MLNENLAYALRISLNLNRPFLLIVDYRNEHSEKVIARSFKNT